MATGLEQIAELKEQAAANYRETVLAMAQGDRIDAADLFGLLATTAKTPDQLHADVERVQNRLRAAEELREADRLTPKIAPLEAKSREAMDAHSRLEQECKAKLEAAYDAYRAADERASDLRHRQSDMRQRAKETLAAGADPRIDAEIAERRRQIERHRQYLAANVYNAEAAAVERKRHAEQDIARLEAEISQLEASKLDPLNVQIV